jgi:hypothetical protein
MPDVFVSIVAALAAVGIVAALMGVAAVWQRVNGLDARLKNLENHGAGHRAAVSITESVMLEVLKLFEDHQVEGARLENVADKIEFIRHGGNPDAPWSEIYRWKNAQKK